jgi:hypothetical protein
VTFDREAARDDTLVLLLTASHPLIRQAAAHLAGDNPLHVSLRVRSTTVPTGRHDFAVYQWRMTGLRADAKLVPVTQGNIGFEAFFGLLWEAEDAESASSANPETSGLDLRHHTLWSEARNAHRNETSATSAFRRESFLTSHDTRIATLKDLERSASEPRIRKMRGAQIAAAEAEAKHRLAEFAKAEREADILFRPVLYGTLEVQAE